MRTAPSFEAGEGPALASITNIVRDIEFPIRKAVLLEGWGHAQVDVGGGLLLPLRELVAVFEDDEFPSLAFVLAAAKVALRRRRPARAREDARRVQPPRKPGAWA